MALLQYLKLKIKKMSAIIFFVKCIFASRRKEKREILIAAVAQKNENIILICNAFYDDVL